MLKNILKDNAFWLFNKRLTSQLGLLPTAILCGLINKYYYLLENEPDSLLIINGKKYFYYTADQFENDFKVTYKVQKPAHKLLKQIGFYETRLKGVPAKTYYHINEDMILTFLTAESQDLQQFIPKGQTSIAQKDEQADPSLAQRDKQELPKGTDKHSPKGQELKTNKENKEEEQSNKKENIKEKGNGMDESNIVQLPVQAQPGESKPLVTESDFKNEFEKARKIYPGLVRGTETEWKYFLKCTKEKYKEIVPLLVPAIKYQLEARKRLTAKKEFTEDWKHFKSWVYNSYWEIEYPIMKRDLNPAGEQAGSQGKPDYSTWIDNGDHYEHPETGKLIYKVAK